MLKLNICALSLFFMLLIISMPRRNCIVQSAEEVTLTAHRFRDTSPFQSHKSFEIASHKNSFRSNDLCELNNGKKLYLEKGDYGELIGTAFVVQSKYFDDPQPNGTTKMSYECSTEIITCPSCIIKLNITIQLHDDTCTTDYLVIGEPPYLNDNATYGQKFCHRSENQLKSLTRNLLIRFIYSTNHSIGFHIDYIAEKNQITIIDHDRQYSGTPTDNSLENPIYISSPYFPMYYPRDYGMEYIIKCNPNNFLLSQCFIRITFIDFQISGASTFEVFDFFNDTEPINTNIYSGSMFRPPIIFSVNSTLILRFYANGGTGLGFRGEINFIKLLPVEHKPQPKGNSQLNPSLNCGGFVETLGGAITMMNMLAYEDSQDNDNKTGGGQEKLRKYYDCIWIIKPSNSFLHLKTHLLTRVDSFDKMAEGSQLVLKQGQTSNRNILEVLIAVSGNLNLRSKTYIAPLATGFYVSFKGSFGADTKLAISYAAFSYMDCLVGSEFLCENHRCIPIQLHCDGFDHCGDGSDEPSTCPTTWQADDFESKWYSHTPNYYFPKTEQYPDLKAATIIFMLSCLGLLLLITALIVLLYRMGARARQQRELQNHLQTISELLDNNRHENLFSDEPPPIYEAPPDYDEVIKVGIDDDFYQKGVRKSEGRNRRPRINEECDVPGNSNDLLQVDAPEHFNENNTSTSGTSPMMDLLTPTYRLEATTTHAFSSNQQSTPNYKPSCSPIPDSPPPTYQYTSSIMKTSHHDILMPIQIGIPNTSLAACNGTYPVSVSLDELQQVSCRNDIILGANSSPNMVASSSAKIPSIFDTSIFKPMFTSSEASVKRHLCNNCLQLFHSTRSACNVMQSLRSDFDLIDDNEICLCCPICGDAATIPFLGESSASNNIPRSLSYEHIMDSCNSITKTDIIDLD